jgi:hypothetical protein
VIRSAALLPALVLVLAVLALAACGGGSKPPSGEVAKGQGGTVKTAGTTWRGYRTANDPCGDNPAPHFEGFALSCGAVFELPGNRTWRLPDDLRGPDCPEGMFAPRSNFDWHFGYWTHNGEWIVWNGHVEGVWRGKTRDAFGDHQWLVNVVPWFHNWGPDPWKMRAFYFCRGR